MVDLIIHLFDIEHHQISHFQHFVNHRCEFTHVAIGV
ncbi:Uncharacterised protein [Vibrio cholerae]|nr:Uncharacterised protein [Vibrio cholerae]